MFSFLRLVQYDILWLKISDNTLSKEEFKPL